MLLRKCNTKIIVCSTEQTGDRKSYVIPEREREREILIPDTFPCRHHTAVGQNQSAKRYKKIYCVYLCFKNFDTILYFTIFQQSTNDFDS